LAQGCSEPIIIPHDLQAAPLHLLGSGHLRLTYYFPYDFSLI
jgi:hypothetical protein